MIVKTRRLRRHRCQATAARRATVSKVTGPRRQVNMGLHLSRATVLLLRDNTVPLLLSRATDNPLKDSMGNLLRGNTANLLKATANSSGPHSLATRHKAIPLQDSLATLLEGIKLPCIGTRNAKVFPCATWRLKLDRIAFHLFLMAVMISWI